MLNLVEKFTTETVEAHDEGVVAIEYVLIAGFVFVGVGIVFSTTDLWTKMETALSDLF